MDDFMPAVFERLKRSLHRDFYPGEPFYSRKEMFEKGILTNLDKWWDHRLRTVIFLVHAAYATLRAHKFSEEKAWDELLRFHPSGAPEVDDVIQRAEKAEAELKRLRTILADLAGGLV